MDASDSKAPMYPQNKLCALHDVTIQNLTISGTSSILHSFIFCTSIVSCTEHNVTTPQTTAYGKSGGKTQVGFFYWQRYQLTEVNVMIFSPWQLTYTYLK